MGLSCHRKAQGQDTVQSNACYTHQKRLLAILIRHATVGACSYGHAVAVITVAHHVGISTALTSTMLAGPVST